MKQEFQNTNAKQIWSNNELCAQFLRGYSAGEILGREEELSLVMYLNRIRTKEDLDFSRLTPKQRETMERIVEKAPEEVLKIVGEMIWHFGLKLKLPEGEIASSLESDLEEIGEKIRFVSKFAPDYEMDRILSEWQKKLEK